MDKTLHDNYICLVESNMQLVKEARSKTQPQNLAAKTTRKRVWICPMHSASVAFSWLEDKNEEIN